jgi:hypothetical protein
MEDIQISRETLRAELGALELRLVDRLTTSLNQKADAGLVTAVEARIAALELLNVKQAEAVTTVPELENRVNKLETAGIRLSGVWSVITIFAVSLAGIGGLAIALLNLITINN